MGSGHAGGGLQLWGGLESTVNRVGDGYLDQTIANGHQTRPEDLDLIAAMGVRALRYPALWERVSPDRPDLADWAWTDERLTRLRTLDVKPILGLLHHGSGPVYTNLLDDGFASGLAAHAKAVAERYPWVEDYTPVNEPLTTARFSALYGHWYPHMRDDRSFWQALLNEIDGTRLAMREIRRVNPQARLIQTEDLGRIYSTAPLIDQAAYENHRRWMSFDLLAGKVGRDHPFWEPLARLGLEDRLRAILDDPSPPDVFGINHYLTSDRFLDHRAEDYPVVYRGGNGRQAYADVPAIRVLDPAPCGFAGALEETLSRYGGAVAVTEAHNGCTREEQLRWLREVWQTAERLRGEGRDVVAVTVWALLGSHDWASLLTVRGSGYEPGAFDLRGAAPRATAIADMARRLGAKESLPEASVGQGWWRRDIRFEHPPRTSPDKTTAPSLPRQRRQRPILITGATGTLGQAMARACDHRGLTHVLTSRRHLRLGDEGSVERALDRIDPWLVVNTAGWVRVDDAEADRDGCIAANAEGAVGLAQACARRDLPMVTFSSDLVFDGASGRPYVESDAPSPLNVYGLSKAMAEEGVVASGARALIVRTAAFFSADDPHNFAHHVQTQLAAGRRLEAAGDLVISPTFVPDLVAATLDLAIDGETGIWHLANQGAVSWAEFARLIAESLGLDSRLVGEKPAKSFGWAAARPGFAALDSARARVMPELGGAISRYSAAVRAQPQEITARVA